MIDHIIGKPSPKWKRTQVLITLIIGWYFVLRGRTRQLPSIIQNINEKSVGGSPWRMVFASFLIQYFIKNIFLLVGLNEFLEAPDPLGKSYNRNFYRATWIMTALDAGFFTAMPLKPKWLRNILSIIFSGYYLVFADAADEKVRRIRATISVEQLRYSWEKADRNPFLRVFSRWILQPRMQLRDRIEVKRPNDKPPVDVYRYYARDADTWADHDTILMNTPGGGFIAMPPPCHEDALTSWAKRTGLPVISVNYKKAPEYPFPWSIEECFDLYNSILQTNGKVIGLSGEKEIKIILAGDSAGGNIACGITMKAIKQCIPRPIGLILVYPALDFELSCWMPPAQLSLMRAGSRTSLFRSNSFQSILQSKDHLSRASPLSSVPDTTEKSKYPIKDKIKTYEAWAASRVAMTSRMTFFNDRILTPQLLRAMAILYLGPHAFPDFGSDCLLSPIHIPEEILAQFPSTYMMCGEKDPLVDDTVILAGRIRQARLRYRQSHPLDEDFPEGDGVRVKFLEGMSHAFLQMLAFLPESKQAIKTLGDWMIEIQNNAQRKPVNRPLAHDHLAEIVTNEKDLFYRRKQFVVNGLY